MNFKSARETLAILKQCAVDAGIYHAWFLAFGTLLGHVRPSVRQVGLEKKLVRGFIDWDHDMDIGVMADQITGDQEYDYLFRLKSAGMFGGLAYEKRHSLRADNGRHAWLSVLKGPSDVKCCHWFWFEHAGYQWHSKGKRWINPMKFEQRNVKYKETDEAIGLGVPKNLLQHIVEIDFEGGRYNVPLMAGSLCDLWYPCWATPKTAGSSDKKHVLVIGKWKDRESWKVLPPPVIPSV